MLTQKLAGEGVNETCPSTQTSPLIGFALTFTMACLNASISFITGIASKSVSVPAYTENFARCSAAALITAGLAYYNGDKLIHDAETMKSLAWLGIADWFFLWGYVKCLAYVGGTTFAAENMSMTPVIVAFVSFAVLSERTNCTKVAAMLRNLVVVILVVDPLGFFDTARPGSPQSSSGSSLLIGSAWCLVACTGTAFMRVLQKSLNHVPGTVTSFWCFAINAVLWFPPGSIPPETRLPFLWPHTGEDKIWFSEIPAHVWACTIASGMLGGIMIAGQSVTLRHIDVGTYSNLVSPLGLLLSFLADACVNGPPQSPRVFFGLSIAVIGCAAEGVAGVLAQGRAPKTSG